MTEPKREGADAFLLLAKSVQLDRAQLATVCILPLLGECKDENSVTVTTLGLAFIENIFFIISGVLLIHI